MRYFFAILALLIVSVIGIAGFRGSMSRKPPLEVFPDMKRQPKIRPQSASTFFADGLASRPPVAGTIARGSPYQDIPVNTGRATGTTNWIENMPVAMTAALMARGQERYQIFCLPCHGANGDGNGITTKYGMLRAGNFHDPRLVRMTDGEYFHVITYGRNLMPPYASQIDIPDRWAVIAYVRALQRSQLSTSEDAPEQVRSTLK